MPTAGGATFIQCMEGQTELDGDVWVSGDAFGPYLERMPTNPYNAFNTVLVEAGTGSLGGGDTGWHFDSNDGAFTADTDDQVLW